jgi:hypothetical protein
MAEYPLLAAKADMTPPRVFRFYSSEKNLWHL